MYEAQTLSMQSGLEADGARNPAASNWTSEKLRNRNQRFVGRCRSMGVHILPLINLKDEEPGEHGRFWWISTADPTQTQNAGGMLKRCLFTHYSLHRVNHACFFWHCLKSSWITNRSTMAYTGMNQFNRISGVRIFSALSQQMASQHQCKAARECCWSVAKTELWLCLEVIWL